MNNKQITKFLKSIDFFKKSLPEKKNLFKPTPYLNHPFLQSVYNIAQPTINLIFHRQKIYFEDGGHISLDWNRQNQKTNINEHSPILFIMHGLTGGSQMNYLRALVKEATHQGYICACLNSRGINNEMTSPIPFTGLTYYQLQVALKRVHIYYPSSPIFMVGASFGGNYLIRYLLQNSQPNIHGLVTLAPPFNISKVIDDMPSIYQLFFVKRYIEQTVSKHPAMNFWQQIGLVNLQEVKKSKTLREFHSNITIKILGMSSSEELFLNYKIHNHQISQLKVPTLLMISKDDPIVSYSSTPIEQIQKNPYIDLQVTEKGGHMCWFQGILPRRWYPKLVIDFINKLRNKKNDL